MSAMRGIDEFVDFLDWLGTRDMATVCLHYDDYHLLKDRLEKEGARIACCSSAWA
jgi:hypothetical protein